MALLAIKRLIAAKVEGTRGTVEALTNAEAVLQAFEPKADFPVKNTEIVQQGALGVQDELMAGMSSKFDFWIWAAGKGASGVPKWSDFLLASGMTNSGGTFTHTSDETQWKTMTAALYNDGRKKICRGLMFNAKMTFEAGMPLKISFEGLGAYQASPNSDTALLSSITYENVRPPIWAASGAFSLDSLTTIPVSKLEIDFGNQVVPLEDPGYAGGFSYGLIRQRIPKLTADPNALLFASEDLYGRYVAGTTVPFSLVIGTATNNILTVTGNIKLNKFPQDGDRNGVLTDEIDGTIITDSLSIAFS